FTFPHRASELERYGEYITQKFAHHKQQFHGRVIEFDKSIQKHVGSSCQYEFTDPHANLFESHFLPSGKQFSESPNFAKVKKPSASSPSSIIKKDKACRCYNSGQCTQSAVTCCYTHICSFPSCVKAHQECDHHKKDTV
ncbi:hypothetical protein PAXRUDRAFT_165310, partial [Paxillus rubicundulus Ve08.2h10]